MFFSTKGLYNKSFYKQAKFVYIKNTLNTIFTPTSPKGINKSKINTTWNETAPQVPSAGKERGGNGAPVEGHSCVIAEKSKVKKNALVFYNNGLTDSQVDSLRSLLLLYDISLDSIPLRSFGTPWVSSLKKDKKSLSSLTTGKDIKRMVPRKKKEKIFSGNILLLHASSSKERKESERNTETNLSMLYSLLFAFSVQTASPNYIFNSNSFSSLGNIPIFKDSLHSNLKTEIDSKLLPWDSISASPITLSDKKSTSREDIVLSLREWHKDDTFSLLFNYIHNSSIIYSGYLKSTLPQVTSLTEEAYQNEEKPQEPSGPKGFSKERNKERDENVWKISFVRNVHENKNLYSSFYSDKGNRRNAAGRSFFSSYTSSETIIFFNIFFAMESSNMLYGSYNLSFLYNI